MHGMKEGVAKAVVALSVAATLLAASGVARGQTDLPPPRKPVPVAQYPRETAFPNENKAEVGKYLARARTIAGADLYPDFVHRCITDQRFRPRVNNLQFDGLIDPAKVFDQLYFVGQNAVSAWALDTRDGIVLFDALNSADEARDIIVPALRQVGLDPARVRYVVITHSHGDHYGGADYLRQQFGAKLIASEEDWRVMDAMRSSGRIVGPFALPPTRDIAVHDGQTMTVGGEALHFYVTPGHTPGTLSTIFDVTDAGRKHVVAFFGGFGAPREAAVRYTHMASMNRFADLAAAAGADTMIANHPVQDGSFEKMEQLRYRAPGEPNPFVVGPDRIRRYLQLQIACSKVALVRAGLDPERKPS